MIYQVNIREQFWKFWGTRMWLFQVEIWQITSSFFVECKEKRAKKVVINYFDCLLNEKSPNGYHQCVSFVNKREHFDWFLESTNAISSDRNLERRLASHQSAINNGSAAFSTKKSSYTRKELQKSNCGKFENFEDFGKIGKLENHLILYIFKSWNSPLMYKGPPLMYKGPTIKRKWKIGVVLTGPEGWLFVPDPSSRACLLSTYSSSGVQIRRSLPHAQAGILPILI